MTADHMSPFGAFLGFAAVLLIAAALAAPGIVRELRKSRRSNVVEVEFGTVRRLPRKEAAK